MPAQSNDDAPKTPDPPDRTDTAGPTAATADVVGTPGPGGSRPPVPAGRPGSGRRRALQLAACAVALAVAMTAGAVVLGSRDGGGTSTVASAPGLAPELLASGSLAAGISALQSHLKAQPKDAGGWATLGVAYVEQARTDGDPSRYPQAQRALERSLELSPGNDPALAGRAALAAARHRFPEALEYARKALAENAFNERALSVRVDALVELGRYDEASEAVDEADSRRPGVPVFTRYAYVHELRGDVRTARRVLEQALAGATAPGDVAYVASSLGQLSWREGAYGKALAYYERALRADGAYLPALEGRARAQAAGGDRAAAIRGMEEVVARFPLPGPLVVLGELYEARGEEGDPAKARAQYALVDAWTALARTNGVNPDLDTALAAADHGDRGAALRAARAEWERRRTVHTADALAWALHVDGRDDEALRYARRATATGYRDATFLYHRGMIEHATGHAKEARASLSAALELNPGFSPTGSALARKTLKALGGAR
ncbi:tetratricopeptide repeat protein [Streptomyces apricus]|uniref:Tetratricopeptide repeat protein n=1 Tax=Streptomyces apricus TaxID=1828112 RepID=A0A5B0AN20_9ACTN|nr:tetratricopeptide repeat protein [Streptomyces apricus]KAA0931413.1 tetratricopeptide repeat protein [Streptomyces apricus]